MRHLAGNDGGNRGDAQGLTHTVRMTHRVVITQLPLRPERARSQINDRLHHIQRCRIGRSLRSTGLAHHQFDFRKGPQLRVAGLEIIRDLGHRGAGTVTGISRIEPSSRGGMNSRPNGDIVCLATRPTNTRLPTAVNVAA